MRSRRVATQPMCRPWLGTGIRLSVSTRPLQRQDLVGRGVGAVEDLAQPAGGVDVAERAARRGRRDAEQVGGLVVDHRDPPVEVDGEHALLDAVQQGLPLLDQAGDLARLEAERLALDPPRQQQRARRRRAALAMPR